MKIFIYSVHGFDKPFLEQANKNRYILGFTEKALTLETVSLSKGYDAIALFSSDNASAEILEVLNQNGVKYITLRSVGFDHVDLDKAKALGIKVANVPEYSPYAIAEHGVAMLMALNRKLFEAQKLIEIQDFRLDTLVGFDLHKKTVGIIGTGKIGYAFAKIMNGFGCNLLGYDIEENPDADQIDLKYCTLEDLLKNSDIVSLNCPLNVHTHYLIDEPQLNLMKKGAILINTARGAVVNTEALILSLENGKLSGACLDVYEKEKGLFFFDHRTSVIKDELFLKLRTLKNVLITGHQAFLTQEALGGIAETSFKNIDSWLQHDTSDNDLI